MEAPIFHACLRMGCKCPRTNLTLVGADALIGPRRKPVRILRAPPIKLPIAIRNIPRHFRRCGRGILKGAAFRQRPLSRLLINFLAGTRKLPPEEPEPKYSVNLGTAGTTYYDNPSVSRLRGTREPAPFTQGSRRCSRTSAFSDCSRVLISYKERRPWKFPKPAFSDY